MSQPGVSAIQVPRSWAEEHPTKIVETKRQKGLPHLDVSHTFLVSPPCIIPLFGSEKLSICCTICFLTIDTLWGAVVPGYTLHLESERRSVKVET